MAETFYRWETRTDDYFVVVGSVGVVVVVVYDPSL
jgi:hypothetical protein